MSRVFKTDLKPYGEKNTFFAQPFFVYPIQKNLAQSQNKFLDIRSDQDSGSKIKKNSHSSDRTRAKIILKFLV